MKTSSHLLTIPNFFAEASRLRNEFSDRFSNPYDAQKNRFIWDYWNIPGQYTLLRTPAYLFFKRQNYLAWHKHLVLWGRRTLGCWDISPPWMSAYVEGCKQELHADVPHGPWAFVYSLSPRKPKYRGGETLLLKPETLDYWKNFGTSQGYEFPNFVDTVPAKFNQLVCFDPRFPHGVSEVRGVHDVMDARLVIHGWFTEPKTYIEGPLSKKVCDRVLNEAFLQVQDLAAQAPLMAGTLSLQLDVEKSGRVSQVRLATCTLKELSGEIPTTFLRALKSLYAKTTFTSARGKTLVTIPLIFS